MNLASEKIEVEMKALQHDWDILWSLEYINDFEILQYRQRINLIPGISKATSEDFVWRKVTQFYVAKAFWNGEKFMQRAEILHLQGICEKAWYCGIN